MKKENIGTETKKKSKAGKTIIIILAAVVLIAGIGILATYLHKDYGPDGMLMLPTNAQSEVELPEKTLEIDGQKFIIGKTTFKELADAGWKLTDNESGKAIDLEEVLTEPENGGIASNLTITRGETELNMGYQINSNQKYGEAVCGGFDGANGGSQEITAAGQKIYLGKTTLKELVDNGWTTNIDLTGICADGSGYICYNNEFFWVNFISDGIQSTGNAPLMQIG